MPQIHELKSWSEFFTAVSAGHKTHELRHNDRDFRVGDLLRLREFDPTSQQYSGRELFVEVTYITSADVPCAISRRALHADFAILSIKVRSEVLDWNQEKPDVAAWITA